MMRSLVRTTVAAAMLTIAPAMPAAAQDYAIVATRVIYPGETIEMDALNEVPLRAGTRVPDSVVLFFDQIEGKVAKRTLVPGKFIPTGSLREPYVVEAGTAVNVSFEQHGLHISTLGVPLQPGATGDMIKVRNADSGTIVTGIVMADGTVRIGRP